MPRRFSYLPTAEDFFIHIGWEDDPTSIIGVPPARVNKEYLDNFFKVDIAYLKDEALDVFWPHQWETLKPKPYKYFIFVRDPHLKLVDASKDVNYVGSSQLCVVNVPGKITVDELLLWIRTGLEACDPVVSATRERLHKAQQKLLKVHQDRDYFLDNHNYVAKAGEEDNDDAVPEVIRSKEQFQRIMRKRKQLLNRVSKLKRELNGVAMDIKTMPILVENVWAQGTERTKEEDPFRAKNKTEVELNEDKEKEMDRVYTWKVNLHHDDARRYMECAVDFDGWGRVLLMPKRRKQKKALCRYVPPGAELVQDDEEEGRIMETLLDFSINMKEVYLINLRDGEGSFESALKTVFSGQWKVGFRHGHGIEIGLHGRYTGTYVKNVRKGRGKLEYPNGDRWDGEMGAGTEGEWPERKDPSVKHWGRSFAAEPRITAEMIAAMPQLPRQRQQLRPVTELGPLAGLPERPPYYAPPPLFTIRSADDFTPNPYLIGVPHGEGVVTFADGSTYEGQMHNGYPHGYGMYKGIDGEIKKGMFRRGVLQGMGTHTLRDGTTRTGLFRDGEIIRRGFEKCPDGEEYEGDFHADHRHGLGRSVNNAKGAFWEYDGSWRFGAKQAIGSASSLDEEKLGFRVFANWAADNMRPRSSFTRLRPKALQGYRVDNAFPPMDFCTHLGVVADGKVAEDIIGRVRRRGDMERNMKYLTENAIKRTRKRLGIGSRMHHKRWIRMRRIWTRFSQQWKDLLHQRELDAEDLALAYKRAAQVQERVRQGHQRRQSVSGAGAGAGAGAESTVDSFTGITSTVGGDSSLV